MTIEKVQYKLKRVVPLRNFSKEVKFPKWVSSDAAFGLFVFGLGAIVLLKVRGLGVGSGYTFAIAIAFACLGYWIYSARKAHRAKAKMKGVELEEYLAYIENEQLYVHADVKAQIFDLVNISEVLKSQESESMGLVIRYNDGRGFTHHFNDVPDVSEIDRIVSFVNEYAHHNQQFK